MPTAPIQRRGSLLGLALCLLATILTLYIFFQLRSDGKRLVEAEFLDAARTRANTVLMRIETCVHILHAMQGFCVAQGKSVDSATFARFVATERAEHPEILLLGCAPREVSPEGQERFVLQIFEPSDGPATLEGADLAVIPEVASAIRDAAATRRVQASHTPDASTGPRRSWLLLPMYASEPNPVQGGPQQLICLAVLLLDLEPLLSDSETLSSRGTMDCELWEGAPPHAGALMARAGPADGALDGAPLEWSTSIGPGGMAWWIRIRGGENFFAPRRGGPAWVVLACGGLVTLMIAFYSLRTSRRRRRLEQAVADRTAALSREVEEHRIAVQRLRLYEIAVRDMSEGFIITDAEPHPDGFRVLTVNEAMCRLAGRTREEMVGARTGVLHGPDTPRTRDDPSATRLFHDGQICLGRTVHYRKDGSRFIAECMASPLYDETGRITHYVSVQRDVSAQVEAERALAESRRVLQDMVDHSPSHVFMRDHEGRFVLVNEAWSRFSGVPAERAIGRTVRDLFPPELAAMFEQRDRTVIEGASAIKFEDAIPSQGRTLRFLTVLFPLGMEGGRPTSIGGIATDITKRKRIEEETIREYNRRLSAAMEDLARLQKQAIRQERLNALGQMASGIAHDFNNALSPILGFTELLLSDPGAQEDPERRERYLGTIRTAAKDASSVVQRLREFYRKREGDEPFEEVDLRKLVEDVVQLSRPRWQGQSRERGLRVGVTTDLVEVPRVCGVPADLREALTNLLFNAVDAMPQGGTITLRTRPAPVAGFVDVEVSDTGLGMTEEVRRRCLEPFFTTKGRDGTGMGLAMVYGIVQRHGGSVEIESTPGSGSTFRLRLPAASPKTGSVALAVPSAAPSRSLRILAVDDEPLIREVLAGYLGLDGHHVQKAAHGREALDRLHLDGIDLVVTDAAMPVMGGLELAKAVKAQYPGTPVILLTGFGDTMKAHGTTPEGVDLVLGKPATIEALRAAIAQVIGPARACPT